MLRSLMSRRGERSEKNRETDLEECLCQCQTALRLNSNEASHAVAPLRRLAAEPISFDGFADGSLRPRKPSARSEPKRSSISGIFRRSFRLSRLALNERAPLWRNVVRSTSSSSSSQRPSRLVYLFAGCAHIVANTLAPRADSVHRRRRHSRRLHEYGD